MCRTTHQGGVLLDQYSPRRTDTMTEAQPKATVLLLRRDPESLREAEREVLDRLFPEGYTVMRTDPRNFQDHIDNCMQFRAQMVVLPADKPIPEAALEQGFRHMFFTPIGPQELLSIEVETRPI